MTDPLVRLAALPRPMSIAAAARRADEIERCGDDHVAAVMRALIAEVEVLRDVADALAAELKETRGDIIAADEALLARAEERDEARAEAARWKVNHDEQVRRKRNLHARHVALRQEAARLRAALERIANHRTDPYGPLGPGDAPIYPEENMREIARDALRGEA